MLLWVNEPTNWLTGVTEHQKWCLSVISDAPPEPAHYSRDQFDNSKLASFALFRLNNGAIGLSRDNSKILTLQHGDCWLGTTSQHLQWEQDGAVDIETWSWDQIPPDAIPKMVMGFNDHILSILLSNIAGTANASLMDKLESYQSGQVIIREGEPANSVFTLIQGKATVFKDQVQVGVAKEGEILGLQGLLLNRPRTASVIADGACTVIKVTYDHFNNLIENRPDLVISSMKTMANQIEFLNQKIAKLSD